MNEPAKRPQSIADNVLALFFGFTLLDFCAGVLAVTESTGLGALLLFAGLAAQFALAAAWAVLAPRPLVERTLISVLAAAWWLGAGILPMAPDAQPESAFARWFLSFFPWALLAAHVPLWTCRLAFGWHVVRGVEPGPVAVSRRQFGMRQLLAVVTTAAIWLGVLRLALAAVSEGGKSGAQWTAVTVVVVILWSGLLMVPCVYFALGARQPTKAPFLIALALGALCLMAVVTGAFRGGEDAFVLAASHVIFVGLFRRNLLTARRLGFVLRWAPRRTRMTGP